MISQTDEFRKMDNDSADITSSGRSFHVPGPTARKAWLIGDGCQLDWRHCQTIGDSRTEKLATRQVSDIVEWTEIVRRIAYDDDDDHDESMKLVFVQFSSYKQSQTAT